MQSYFAFVWNESDRYAQNQSNTDSNGYFHRPLHGVRLPTAWTKTKETRLFVIPFIIGIRVVILIILPWENIILRHTPKAEMQNISSKLHAAITSVMIPLSSPRPLCLKSNSAGRMTAELTGLKMHLCRPRTKHMFFRDCNIIIIIIIRAYFKIFLEVRKTFSLYF
jgi:hypothetical protein